MNECTACGMDFSSVAMFDRHRVGKHDYLASDARPDGRRCLDPEEMMLKGWERDRRGRWSDPESNARVRDAFAGRKA